MNRKFINSESTTQSISTKYTTISHLKSLNIKKTPAYGVGNPGLDWRRTLKCSGATPVNGIATLPS
jgi:hypothetical protein